MPTTGTATGTKQQQAAAVTRHKLGKPHATGHCTTCQHEVQPAIRRTA